MTFTLLGTGSAAQVPVYNCTCMACQRARHTARYRRGPCSALVETGTQRWLIDAGLTDLTERFPPGSLSGIMLTHYHADHAQGLLHLRWGTGLKIPVLGPPDPEGLADLYKHPGILDFSTSLRAFVPLVLGDLRLTPVPLAHSRLTFGFLLEQAGRSIAYLTDTVGLPEDTLLFLRQHEVDLLVLDCTHAPASQPPRNHNDLPRALDSIAALQPRQAVLTHIGHDLDAFLIAHPASDLKGAELGFDGDVFHLPP
ncbi:phosphonate metabolism protein PhnP [Allopusillimonas ginsengisoli]|nr:phosphonate metabolism protein PhnP [Allopusillimonas ginsengisoli]